MKNLLRSALKPRFLRPSSYHTPVRLFLSALSVAMLAACVHDNSHPPTTPATAAQSRHTESNTFVETPPDRFAGEWHPATMDNPFDAEEDVVSHSSISDTLAPEDHAMTVLVIESPEHLAKLVEHQRAAMLAESNDEHHEPVTPLPQPEQRLFHFDFDQAQLSEADLAELQNHALYLLEHPGINIRINGHTDAQGHRAYNQKLSERRARQASLLLQQMGVDEPRIEIMGWGSQVPLEGGARHRDHRRIEVEYIDAQFAANH